MKRAELDAALEEQWELAGHLASEGRHSEYFEVVQTLKREEPEVYAAGRTMFDQVAIAELMLADRRPEVAAWLEPPAEDPEALASLLDLLLAVGCDTEASALARRAGPAVKQSRRVDDPNFLVEWILFQEVEPFLDARDASSAAVARIEAAMKKLSLRFERAFIQAELADALGAFPDPAPLAKRQPQLAFAYHERLARHFLHWLKLEVGLSWASARFYASVAGALWVQHALERPKAPPFRLEPEVLDGYLEEQGAAGVRALALVQALWWQGPYLRKQGALDAKGVSGLRERLADAQERILEGLDVRDPGPRLLPDPARFRWLERRANAKA